MTGPKTNERPGTRAQAKNVRMSATKARVVLDLIRGVPVDEARAVLAYTERAAAEVVGKCLESAVANAEHNDEIDPETLYVAACYADEGRTMYRWRPRARGRATRIRKRTCHVTVIVSPMPAEMLAAEQAKREAIPGSRAARRRGQEAARRSERVAASQQSDDVAEAAEPSTEGSEGIVDQDAPATEATAAAIADEAIAAGDEAAATPEVEQTEATEAIEEEGIVDTDVEGATRAAEDSEEGAEEASVPGTDAEAADETDTVDATAPIADDVEDAAEGGDDEDTDEESK